MDTEQKKKNINRVAVLYYDLLSKTIKPLEDSEKNLLLKVEPLDKTVVIGDIDESNWNTYPLTYLLDRHLISPTVLDESKIYQVIHAMRTNNKEIIHPQYLISQSVVIRITGKDNSQNMNEYLNTFINMCKMSDTCKIIFIILKGNKRYFKDYIYKRKYNSSFIDYTSPDKSAVKIEGDALDISADHIVYFNYSKKEQSNIYSPNASGKLEVNSKKIKSSKGQCTSLVNDSNYF